MKNFNKFQILGIIMVIAAIVFLALDYDTVAMVLAVLGVTTLMIERMKGRKLPRK